MAEQSLRKKKGSEGGLTKPLSQSRVGGSRLSLSELKIALKGLMKKANILIISRRSSRLVYLAHYKTVPPVFLA